MTTIKQLGGLALYGVAYLTAMAIGQVVANTHLILTTLEDLIMELATVTEITECVITPDYVDYEDTGADHCYPVQAEVVDELTLGSEPVPVAAEPVAAEPTMVAALVELPIAQLTYTERAATTARYDADYIAQVTEYAKLSVKQLRVIAKERNIKTRVNGQEMIKSRLVKLLVTTTR